MKEILIQKAFACGCIAVLLRALVMSRGTNAELDASGCERAWHTSQADILRCRLDYVMSNNERAKLISETSGVLQDIACHTNVRVSKGNLVGHLLSANVLRIPSQQIQCHLQTNRDTIPISFTVAPQIWISGDQATSAQVNLSGVQGLPLFLARLLERHVNQSQEVEQSLVDAVNDLISAL